MGEVAAIKSFLQDQLDYLDNSSIYEREEQLRRADGILVNTLRVLTKVEHIVLVNQIIDKYLQIKGY